MANNQNLKPFKPGFDERRHLEGKKVVPDLKNLVLEEVGEEGLRDIIRKLGQLAKAGNLKAIQEILDRAFGKPRQEIAYEGTVTQRLEHLNDQQLNQLIDQIINHD